MSDVLAAYHNITEKKLAKALALGGLAAPSLAITRPEFSFENYGPITLVAPMWLVDPKLSKVDIYSRDAFTGRMPPCTYKRIPESKKRALLLRFRETLERIGPSHLSAFDYKLYKEPPERFFQSFQSDPAVKIAFLEEATGKKVPIRKTQDGYINFSMTFSPYEDLLSQAYEQWSKEIFEKYAGPPLLELGNRKVPYTLENATRYMLRFRGRGKEETLVFASGKVAAALTKRYSTLSGAHKDSALLFPRDAVQNALDFNSALGDKYRTAVIPYYRVKNSIGRVKAFDAIDQAMKSLSEIGSLKREPSREELQAALARNLFSTVPDDILDSGLAAWKALRDCPTQYFEAKVWRAVLFNEFAAIVAPLDMDGKIKEHLRKLKIRTSYYDPAKKNGRVEAVQAVHRNCPATCLVNGRYPFPEKNREKGGR